MASSITETTDEVSDEDDAIAQAEQIVNKIES